MPPSRRRAIGMPKAKKSKLSFAATDEVIEYDDAEATVEEEPLQALDDEPGDEPEPEPEASAEASGKKRGRPAHTPLQKAEKAMEVAETAYWHEQAAWTRQLIDLKFCSHPDIRWSPDSVIQRLEASMDKRDSKLRERLVAWEDSREAYVEARVGAAIDLAVQHVMERRDAEVAMLRDYVSRLAEGLGKAKIALKAAHSDVALKRYELECDMRQLDIERLRLNGVL